MLPAPAEADRPRSRPRALAAALTFPLVMAASVGVAAWGLARGWPVGPFAFALTVGNLVTIALLERLLPLRPEADLLRDRQSLNDVGHGVLLTTVGRPLGANLSVLALAGLAGLASERFEGDLAIWPVTWPFAAQLALGLAIYGFLDYWKHRAYHSFDALWWIHAVHHDTRQMHVLKAGRLHLLEGAIRFVLVTTPLVVMGAPAELFVWIGLWMNFEGNLNHSNLDQRFPGWLHYVYPTVQVHHLHHARERRLQDSNFAGVSTLFDVVFGTFRHPDAHPFEGYGIEGDPVPAGFVAQLLYPLRRWFGGATGAGGGASVGGSLAIPRAIRLRRSASRTTPS
jgi:sterol desaturase/sphingolipid hydroxylase (fatty acid hydroxylase superfamily)